MSLGLIGKLDEKTGLVSLSDSEIEENMDAIADEVFKSFSIPSGVLMVGGVKSPLCVYDKDTQEKIVGELVLHYNIAPVDDMNLEELKNTEPALWVLEMKGPGYSQRIKEIGILNSWLDGYFGTS